MSEGGRNGQMRQYAAMANAAVRSRLPARRFRGMAKNRQMRIRKIATAPKTLEATVSAMKTMVRAYQRRRRRSSARHRHTTTSGRRQSAAPCGTSSHTTIVWRRRLVQRYARLKFGSWIRARAGEVREYANAAQKL